MRKRDTRRILYTYDVLNRVTAKTYPDGGATAVHYGYDLRGLQLFARYGSASGEGVTSAWNGFGRLISATTNMGWTPRTLAYRYDPNGNRVRITHPDGTFFAYEFDQAARLNFIRENGAASGLGVPITIGYAPDGDRGAVVAASGAVTAYGYDGIGRPSLLLHDLAGTTGDVTWTYTRNAASGIATQTRDNDTYAWQGHYAVNRGYTTNGLNQYSAVGGGTFGYDPNGNLTSSPGPHPGETLSYVYDIENRLVGSVSSTGASPSVTIFYDPLGRLFSLTASGTTTEFLYDGDALVGEYAWGNQTERYVHGSDAVADDPLIWYHGPALTDRRWLHPDHQGSIVATSTGTGALGTIYTYDEYGIPDASSPDRFRYTGQIWLPELGMYHYKARVYSPTLGRFLQTDPIGYDDQFNLYAYVANDPGNHTDPDGRELTCVTKAGGCTGQHPVSDYISGVARDLANLAGLVAKGDFQTALGGMPPTLGGGFSSVPRVATTIPSTVRATTSGEGAAIRAGQIQAELDSIAQSRRTTAVLQTDRGTIVSSGGRDLAPAQIQALQPGERAARAPGMHAEATAMQEARASGSRPLALGTSRPMCPNCIREVIQSGGTVTSPMTAIWQSELRGLLPF